ncbi:SpoIIE family protein phosphatase [Streptacidiphilus anmyonensis]|uniref:SpoIIE family protein phosphatase n=1 Tax=Streptacidiphilus anmyonensis TaxID=405782 RepID=UPI000694896B|nr:SpoIIE family protein phosphatase [Streptacidiphilus anmyonensis]
MGEGLGDALLGALFTQSPLGLQLYDPELRLVRVNSAARLVREVPDDRILGRSLREILQLFEVTDSDVAERTAHHVLESGQPVLGLPLRFRSPEDPSVQIVISVGLFRLDRADGSVLGLACSLSDVTARVRAEAGLRLLADAAARVGTTLDVFRTAEEFCEVTCPALADTVTVDVFDVVLRGQAPSSDSPAGNMTMRRAGFRSVAGAETQGVPLVGEVDLYPPDTPYRTALDTLTPTLISPLRVDDGWLDPGRRRDARIIAAGTHSMITMPIRARGLVLGLACFYRWRDPIPFDRAALELAEQVTAHAGQCLDNARLYGRERSVARITAGGPSHPRTSVEAAADLAQAYLPTGTGGGWFDAVPLSGDRVALVAGDTTTGSADPAAMGELRAAIEALSDLDLPPDEILERLHGLASRPTQDIDAEAAGDAPDAGQPTCLYLAYDPVTRLCTTASAGHPPPVLVLPGGEVDVLNVDAGPALGRGLPQYRVTERVLPEGSTLLIYNTALVDASTDAAAPLPDRVAEVVAVPRASLQATCDALAAALAPDRPQRDAYLLLARTRALGPDRTGAWTLPNSPESVGVARRRSAELLRRWGMEGEIVDSTALIVSELVTNAIRYAKGPVELRLIRGETLVCEVSDGSNTAPQLRRALDTDENGRGLFITAQLTQRWGVRPSDRGKTLWAEQALP